MRRYSPQEKKRMRYTRDRIRYGESDKGTRTSVPRAKRKIQRAHRRTVSMQLHELRDAADDHPWDIEDLELVVARRKRFFSFGAETVEDYVRGRLQARTVNAGWNLFKTPLRPDDEEAIERFETMLVAWTASSRGENARLARLVSVYLDPEPWLALDFTVVRGVVGASHWHIERRALCFKTFLECRPEWRERLWTWIRSAT